MRSYYKKYIKQESITLYDQTAPKRKKKPNTPIKQKNSDQCSIFLKLH